jgi:hypothetical protein
MSICVKCGEVKGIVEVGGELYCNACYQLLDEKVRSGEEKVKDLESEKKVLIEKVIVQPTWGLAWGLMWRMFIIYLIPAAFVALIALMMGLIG